MLEEGKPQHNVPNKNISVHALALKQQLRFNLDGANLLSQQQEAAVTACRGYSTQLCF